MIDAVTAEPPSGLDAPSSDVPTNSGALAQFGAPGALRFGDYLLEEEVAHGGMGVVYRANQLSLGRIVAVKMLLLGRYSSAESIDRFRREAHSAASLRHPNIVAIYEVGESQGQHFLSMEFVDGPSLAGVLRQGPLNPRRAAEYARTIAEAVHYAHTQGVLHRDIKPSNVLLDAFDQVRLTDFGLAKKLDGSSDMTLSGQMVGSPNYLSPEQAAGKQSQIGPPSDVYGIGALLYELLTGRPPFMAQSLQDTLLHIRDTDAVAPTTLNPAIPRDLDTITLKCLEKAPEKRYATAGALAEDLRRFLHHEPISARPISVGERLWKAICRHRVRAALIATAVASLLSLTVGSLWFSVRVNRAHAEVQAANRRLAHNLFVREWQDAEQLIDAGKPRSALTWFGRAVRQDPTDSVATTRLLALLGEQTFSVPAGPVLTHPAAVLSADFSPDGDRVVTGAGDGKVRIWSWRDGRLLLTLASDFTGPGPAVSFVPGTGRILVADERALSLWSAHGALEKSEPGRHAGKLHWAMARDGSSAALVSNASEPQLWDPRTLQLVRALNLGNPGVLPTALSPDGRYVLRPLENAGIGVWDLRSGQQVWHSSLPDADSSDWMYAGAMSDDNRLVAVSTWGGHAFVTRFRPDPGDETTKDANAATPIKVGPFRAEKLQFFNHDRNLVIASGDGVVCISDLATGELLPSRVQHLGPVPSVCISPDGATLASASIDGTVRFWDLRPQRPQPTVLKLENEIRDLPVSPDGKWFVAANSSTAEVRDVQTTSLRFRLPMENSITCVEVSPDGRRIATTTGNGLLRVWDSMTGAPVTPTVHLIEAHQGLTFSADSRWVCVGAPSDRLFILDTETGQPVFPAFHSRVAVVRSVITPDKRTLISADLHGDVQFWSLPDGKERPAESRHKGVVWSARLSRDGALLATASGDQTTRIWEVASARVLHEFQSEKAVYEAVISQDNRYVLIASADGTARLVEIASGRQVSETMRHNAAVWFAKFSPNGQTIITGDNEGENPGAARVWDARTGLPMSNWLRSSRGLKSVFFLPDGLVVGTVSADRTVKFWPVTVASGPCPSWVSELAEAIAGQRLEDDGSIRPVPFEKWQTLRNQVANLKDNSFYSRWARWFFFERTQTNGTSSAALSQPSR